MGVPVGPGTVIASKYRVRSVLGEGGMGWVVAADHLQLPTQVAIKFLKQQATPELLERFHREARSLAQLKSEHVTRILDVGNLPSGESFIVMEKLEGQDLSAICRARGQLPWPEVVGYILQACVVLREAHNLGIVHRDIKPANLFLTALPDGRQIIKVLDFGISKVNATARGPKTNLTETGAFLGSPNFVSPEQLRSTRNVDGRADIWSLGATIHRLITGRNVFEADSMPNLILSIITDDPPALRSLAPQVPPALENIVAKCLEREPNKRFASIDELTHALRSLGGDTAHASGHGIAVSAAMQPTTGVAESTAIQPNAGKARGGTGRTIGAVLGLMVLLGAGVAAWALLPTSETSADVSDDSEDDDSESDDDSTKKKKKKKSPAKKKNDAPTTSFAAAKGVAYFGQATVVLDALERAHNDKAGLRLYDALFYDERAQFIVATQDGGLARYEAKGGEITGPFPHSLSTATRLDNLLVERDVIDAKVIATIAKDAPRRIGQPSTKPYSVSLQRTSDGLVWAVALESGSSTRYTLTGGAVQ